MSSQSISNTERDDFFQKFRQDASNRLCVDCPANNPYWASVSYGTLFCLECSGQHRGLGVHLSFVRSVTMDTWKRREIAKMEVGGNRQFKEFMSSHGVPDSLPIKVKYNTKAAEAYREKIKAHAEGRKWEAPPRGSLKEDFAALAQQGHGGSGSNGGKRTISPGGGWSDSSTSSSGGGGGSSGDMKYEGFGSDGRAHTINNKENDFFEDSMSWLGSGWNALSTSAASAAASTAEAAKSAGSVIAEKTAAIDTKALNEGMTSVGSTVAESSKNAWGNLSTYWASASTAVSSYAAGDGEEDKEDVDNSNGGGSKLSMDDDDDDFFASAMKPTSGSSSRTSSKPGSRSSSAQRSRPAKPADSALPPPTSDGPDDDEWLRAELAKVGMADTSANATTNAATARDVTDDLLSFDPEEDHDSGNSSLSLDAGGVGWGEGDWGNDPILGEDDDCTSSPTSKDFPGTSTEKAADSTSKPANGWDDGDDWDAFIG